MTEELEREVLERLESEERQQREQAEQKRREAGRRRRSYGHPVVPKVSGRVLDFQLEQTIRFHVDAQPRYVLFKIA